MLRSKMLRIAIFIAYCLAMLSTSLLPMARPNQNDLSIVNLNPDLQNILHIPMFALFVILFILALEKRSKRTNFRYRWLLIWGVVYALFLEFMQTYIPGRYASITDMFFNVLGIGLGFLFWFLLVPCQKESLS